MIKTVILASIALGASAAVALLATPVKAAETVQRTVTVYSMADFPQLKEKAEAVCKRDGVKLSDDARKVCDGSRSWPGVTKAGAFRNAGVGAEFNTLIRQ